MPVGDNGVMATSVRFLKANGAKVVLFFLGLVFLWATVALIGTAASFKPESCDASATCSLLLVRPYDEEAKHILKGGGYRKYRLIETSPDKWGATTVTEQFILNGTILNETTMLSRQTNINVPSAKDFSNLETIANRDIKFALVVIGFVLTKLLKILSLGKMTDIKKTPIKPPGSIGYRSWFLGNLPVHVIHLFFTYDSIEHWLGKNTEKICSLEWVSWRLLDSFMFFSDFCFLTWAPSIATIPFSSIAPEETYINTGEARYELDVFWYMPCCIFLGFISYVIVVCLDARYVKRNGYWQQWNAASSNGPQVNSLSTDVSIDVTKAQQTKWQQWKPADIFTSILRIVAGLARLTIVILLICIPVLAFCLASFDFSLIFGVSLKVLFKASFRFGLMGWATMFRIGLLAMMIIEVLLTAYIFSKGHHYDHYRPWPRAPEKPAETPPPPNPAIPPLPASPPSKLLNVLDSPLKLVQCPVSPAMMCNFALSQELPYDHGMLCSAMPTCSNGSPRSLHHPRYPDQSGESFPRGLPRGSSNGQTRYGSTWEMPDQMRLQSGTAEERVINNDL